MNLHEVICLKCHHTWYVEEKKDEEYQQSRYCPFCGIKFDEIISEVLMGQS